MGKQGPKPKYTVKELDAKIQEYFNNCDANEKPYLVNSLAYHLDVDRDTLLNWEKNNNFSALIKKAKVKIAVYAEEFLFTSNKTAAAIFNLKCNYGWQEVQKIELDGNITIKFGDETEEVVDDENN